MIHPQRPKISIIIALFNAEKEINLCLSSIFESNFKDFEVIVIDDYSTDNSVEIAKKYPVRFFSTEKNSGPAKARNIGAKEAKTDLLFFLDSDTKVEKNSLTLLHESVLNNPEVIGVIGLPNTTSLRKGMAPDYNALKNHYTLFIAEEKNNYFTTQMGAIKKSIFEQVGGFDENFKSADIEDIEFGLRIPEDKKILINKNLIISHHFPHFSKIIKNYFKRSFLLAKYVKKNKKLSKAHANLKGMISVLVVLLTTILLILSWTNKLVFFSFILAGVGFILINSGLFLFVMKKRGFLYGLLAIFFEFCFELSIGLGGLFVYLSKK
ncbi:MAG: glycosyltransferase family A protein [Candidatus Woesearchaeota archaeon]